MKAMDDLGDFQQRYRDSLLEEEREELANHATEINSFKKYMAASVFDILFIYVKRFRSSFFSK